VKGEVATGTESVRKEKEKRSDVIIGEKKLLCSPLRRGKET